MELNQKSWISKNNLITETVKPQKKIAIDISRETGKIPVHDIYEELICLQVPEQE